MYETRLLKLDTFLSVMFYPISIIIIIAIGGDMIYATRRGSLLASQTNFFPKKIGIFTKKLMPTQSHHSRVANRQIKKPRINM